MTPPAEMTVAADSPLKLEYIDCDDQAPTAALSLATKISFASPGAHLSLRICIRRTSPKDGFVSSMMVATKEVLGELEIISDTAHPHRTEDEHIPQCPSLEKLTLDLDSVEAYLPHFLPTPPPSSSLSSFPTPTPATTPDVDDKSLETTGSSRTPDITVRFRIHVQDDSDATDSHTPKPLDSSLDTATQDKLLCLREIVLQRSVKRLTLCPTIRNQTGTDNSTASSAGASSTVTAEREDAEARAKMMVIEREVSSVLGLERGVCDVAFVWEK
ncbi:uncharacterized protein STEHIDRAFT_169591 [Stereum hirsutum FP-91666 SS1]|uniref:uncharacterized protein n=1 Tax=Stereum hirsutum (strain FP-91666) TaxID=721885 RepID=UPI0004449E6C|nr:uncharacterized protein STEHIDRAFT_169591 [Stereum hirsutum FP-91666 SS1]EIM84655.1 hypothetical protein STEHIDRAFT_169591 [Stereum hirsutum FP-91666 SS1]